VKAGDSLFQIDANVILRYILWDHEELSPKSRTIMCAIESGQTRVSCDPVVLSEVVWVLKSFYRLSNEQIAAGLEPFVKAEGFLMPNKERYIHALDLFARSVPHFGDACTCAAAIEECHGRLLSFDLMLSNVAGVVRSEEV
jgi:predicted nucleic acid-binding protein